MTIGQRISELRKERSYSQEYVAEQLNVSRQAVSKWETDLSVPDTNNLIALSQLFAVSVEYLATGKQSEPMLKTSPEVRIEYVPVPQKPALGVQKILGIIFLTMALLALVLGILLENVLFLGVSILWSVIGAILLAVRRYAWLVLLWTLLIAIFFGVCFLTTGNIFAVFDPDYYRGGISNAIWFSFLFYAVFILLGVLTAWIIWRNKKKKKMKEE